MQRKLLLCLAATAALAACKQEAPVPAASAPAPAPAPAHTFAGGINAGVVGEILVPTADFQALQAIPIAIVECFGRFQPGVQAALQAIGILKDIETGALRPLGLSLGGLRHSRLTTSYWASAFRPLWIWVSALAPKRTNWLAPCLAL